MESGCNIMAHILYSRDPIIWYISFWKQLKNYRQVNIARITSNIFIWLCKYFMLLKDHFMQFWLIWIMESKLMLCDLGVERINKNGCKTFENPDFLRPRANNWTKILIGISSIFWKWEIILKKKFPNSAACRLSWR